MSTTPISRWLHLVVVAIATGFICFASWLPMSSAWALTQIRLFDVDYKECPAEIAEGTVTSGGSATPANCFIVFGKTENKSGKPVNNADIFGRIYDANNNPVMQNRTRLGSIDSVEPGIGDFELRITVSDLLATPLKLEQFKASGFVGQVRR
ncbi:hypothetical protein ACQ4M4_21010 [Leptolyngbya sp. AN02str]|uniref:hypothetical protein n=1 Tax=Leptolyngbya sp. AN02str TaxID=3423363 RepID=UPI003D31C44C